MSGEVDQMPLFCELGWHKPDPLARWNAGYYFTTCTRCGSDLVRTAYGGWRVPRGYRVVWQAQPPEGTTAAELVPDGSLDRVPDDQMELPIQEVLRSLDADQLPHAEEVPVSEPVEELAEQRELVGAGDELSYHEPPLAAPSPAATGPERPKHGASAFDDDWFAEEEAADDAWLDGPAASVREENPTQEPHIEDEEGGRIGNRSGKIRYGKEVSAIAGSGLALFARFRGRGHTTGPIEELPDDGDPRDEQARGDSAPSAARDQEVESPSAKRARTSALIAGSFGLLMLFAIAVAGPGRNAVEALKGSSGASVDPSAPSAASAPPPPAPSSFPLARSEETGFVTASLLNCRASPAEQARPVRRLERGDEVRIISIEPAWASVSHQGRQCWTSTRYLSAERPL